MNRLTYNVPELLALVDFSKTEQIQKTEALEKTAGQGDSLHFPVEDSSQHLPIKTGDTATTNTSTWYIVIRCMFALVLLLLLRTRVGRK